MVWPISSQKASFSTMPAQSQPTAIPPVHLTLQGPLRTEQFAAMMIDEDDDFLEDDDEDDEDSSADEAQPPSKTQKANDPKRLPNQALFLNFTSDLNPQKKSKKKSKPKKQAAYKVNGVNILNRNNLDSKTAIERIQRRRENHNHVERRRRDNINNTILELSQVVPNALQPGQKPNKGNILKLALDYIKDLQLDNQRLKIQMDPLATMPFNPSKQSSTPQSPSTPIAQDRHQPFVSQGPQDHQYHNAFQNHYPASTPSLPTSPNPLFSRVFSQTSSPSSPMLPTSTTSSSSASISSASSSSYISGLHYDDSQPGNPPPLSLPPQIGYSGYPGPNTSSTTAGGTNGVSGYHSLPSGSSSPALSQTSYAAPSQPTLYASHSPGPLPPYYGHQYSLAPPGEGVVVLNTSPGVPLRSLLPASQKNASTSPPQSPLGYQPFLRMGGAEKIYGGVCRY
ncbi:hypothetical protein CLU79DRAFT_746214 [Phycomyces nitens]|nr:hypothetical protein CLU79DRAFT_746214 [Phycomyces nitens]